jgi:hypothetical protein
MQAITYRCCKRDCSSTSESIAASSLASTPRVPVWRLSLTWGQGDELICAHGCVRAWWVKTGGGAQSGFPFVAKRETLAVVSPAMWL